MKLKTAIIGMGKMGIIRFNELLKHDGFEVVGVCDLNIEIEEKYKNIQYFTNWRDILAMDLDCVFVCTYNNIAPEIVCAALSRNLHVFSEKPPGRTVDDVKKMIEAEQKSNHCILKFGFNHRFHYAILKAKEIIDSGKYGEIMWARGVYGKAGGIDFENSWRSKKEISGGGILLDQGIHMLDLLLYFLGDVVEVKSMVENMYWKNTDLEDNAFALLKTETGKVAMLHSSATQWRHKFLLELFTEKGFISINGILSSTRSYGEETITFAQKQFEDEASAFGKPREETIYFDRDDSWTLELDEFYQAIIKKASIKNGHSTDALRVMTLIERIYNGG